MFLFWKWNFSAVCDIGINKNWLRILITLAIPDTLQFSLGLVYPVFSQIYVSWFLQACNTCAVRVERKRKRKLIQEQEDATEAASPPKKSRSGRTIKVPRRFSKGAEGRQMWRRSLCAKGLWGGGGYGRRGGHTRCWKERRRLLC